MEPQLSPFNTLLTCFFFHPWGAEKAFYKNHLIRDRALSAMLKIQGKKNSKKKKIFPGISPCTDAFSRSHFFIRNHLAFLWLIVSLETDNCLSDVNFHWRKSRMRREDVLRFQFFIFSSIFPDRYKVCQVWSQIMHSLWQMHQGLTPLLVTFHLCVLKFLHLFRQTESITID